MRLAAFIEQNMEAILIEWEAFAKSLGAVTADMSVDALRDHAQTMLLTIAEDMEEHQSSTAQEEKGKGHRPARGTTAASTHGTGRQHDGFSLLQLTAEFRALRASVLRLWLPTIDRSYPTGLDEMIRFNEALDQAIAESVTMFSGKAGEARDVFLAMLGHDLRSPLNAIGLTTEYLERPEVETPRRLSSANRIKRSVALMNVLVSDLLEFSRLQLGGAIPIVRSPQNFVAIAHRVVEDARAAHPKCEFRLSGPPELPGQFDADRLAQVFGNLINNAAQYRTRGTPVTVGVALDDGCAVVTVHNFGPKIPAAAQEAIFHPLVQLNSTEVEGERPRSSVGLGLFIARQIVAAHGGVLEVASDADTGTVFSARLSCEPPTDPSSHGAG